MVDTDAFAQSLRKCDDTDNRGARDADDNIIGDGFPDFPSSVVYTISYVVDNGLKLAPGTESERRQLEVTITANHDPVSSVIASAVELPAGGEATVVASAVPAYACNANLNFSVADTDIATVDANGKLTGVGTGTTTVTVTSEDNPDASATADVTVTAAFSLAISNDDKDSLGASTGAKEIPTCVTAGIKVEPSMINAELNGAYTYDWMSSNDSDVTFSQSIASGFGAFGAFKAATTVGATSEISVDVATGDTGATAIADVAGKSVMVTTVKNEMCEPGESLHAAGFNTDFNLDGAGAGYGGGGSATANAESVTGTGSSLQITAGALMSADNEPYTWVAQQVWNKQRNWYSWNYGRGVESIGKTYKYSVWVKLAKVPDSPITVKQVITPWVYEGIPAGAAGFGGRRGGAGVLTATLESSTEWQYVEFVNEATDGFEWEIPATWNVVTDVFTLWEVYGLPQGETLLLDEAGVVQTK
ncbi:Ig-like domain-containing protein [Paraglaciecola aquimarina]|uniref:Ig-like domain-containing protein n=1 Tax=Paraglaciecola aquimarina TaxID=1235557 RepID=A0ABU3T244_9ALTE|nr:Ig-like domain-containing protein [Paraglaciecola aquimarina]MDU0356308.1 Ig-like domain-containing protein [Paraglaciecola aquimarina]